MLRRYRGHVTAVLALGTLLAGSTLMPAQTVSPAQKQTPPAKATPKKKSAPKETSAAPTPVTLPLEPKALEVLKAASDRLAAANSLSFVAVETYESPSRQGAPLVYANRSEVTLQRPDKLRVILTGDGPASEFYYDGKTMMAYSPASNTVAIKEAPPTLDKALEAIYHSAAVYFPFTDLIVADPYGDLAPSLKHAYYVGQSKIVGDTTTDIVAYAGDGVFVQAWIGTEDKLPRLIHAVYLNDPDALRHNLLLSDWQIDPAVTEDLFTSSKSAGAKRIEFAHPHPEGTSGIRPSNPKPPTP